MAPRNVSSRGLRPHCGPCSGKHTGESGVRTTGTASCLAEVRGRHHHRVYFDLPDHLERFIGPLRGGWSEDAQGEQLPFQLVAYDDRQYPEVTVVSTLGLSRHVLHSPTTGDAMRQELLIAVREATPAVLSWVSTLAEQALHTPPWLPGGTGHRSARPLVPGSELTGFFRARPVSSWIACAARRAPSRAEPVCRPGSI